ncbi:MAG: HaeIII family restriction endonuclease [Christensenella sp.]
MSSQSNDQGRAYEYICLLTLEKEISKFRPVVIDNNSSFYAAQRAWDSVTEQLQDNLTKAAEAAVQTIFDLEPLIVEDGDDDLELLIQPDNKGKQGDVRDILIVRRGIQWEVGLSMKHNHFAVKHSRLSKALDFGKHWYGVPCSAKYWDDVKPIFLYLNEETRKSTKWRDLPTKEDDVYIPLLTAFVNEVKRTNVTNKDMSSKMVEYLLGEYDFYKVISIDNKKMTQILSFNLRGTLNQAGRSDNPKIAVPVANLPTRIVSLDFKPDSNNTVELYMDGGWQFSFRIHNAATLVEPSLKFDVQIIGMPATIISINCTWN